MLDGVEVRVLCRPDMFSSIKMGKSSLCACTVMLELPPNIKLETQNVTVCCRITISFQRNCGACLLSCLFPLWVSVTVGEGVSTVSLVITIHQRQISVMFSVNNSLISSQYVSKVIHQSSQASVEVWQAGICLLFIMSVPRLVWRETFL